MGTPPEMDCTTSRIRTIAHYMRAGINPWPEWIGDGWVHKKGLGPDECGLSSAELRALRLAQKAGHHPGQDKGGDENKHGA